VIVYLDICALKRPFDDARSERIHSARRLTRTSFRERPYPGARREGRRLLRRALNSAPRWRVEVVRPDQIVLDEEIGA
jgi:hypothetical protein